MKNRNCGEVHLTMERPRPEDWLNEAEKKYHKEDKEAREKLTDDELVILDAILARCGKKVGARTENLWREMIMKSLEHGNTDG